jgi:molybdopterin synthase catalytic subunit
MRVSLRLFAGLREAAGCREAEFELPDGARVDDLKAGIAARFPRVAPLLKTVVFAIDDEYIPAEERLHDGALVSAIPPVSGGGPHPLAPSPSEGEGGAEAVVRVSPSSFWLTTEALEPHQAAIVDMVSRPECGAVALFYGIVRDNAEGKRVLRMEYEALESMARRKIEEVADEVKRRHPEIAEIAVWHRFGMLEVGETSLLVAVSSPHRKEGFEACHWAVDRIKQVVPIWKKEHFADGSAEWVPGHTVELPEAAQP